MAEKQKTIGAPVTISGAGLHTGKNVSLTFRPAPENHGYKFKRVDIEGSPVIRADVDNVIDTSRGTTIEEDGVSVQTIEHTLASLSGLQIDNALIELDCEESPIFDGSSKVFVEALQKAGVVEQKAEKKYFYINSNISYVYSPKKVEMLLVPDDDFRITTMIDYDANVLNTQNATFSNKNDFKADIAPSRTFCFLHELEHMLENNLIKGGDVSNAIVFVNRVISDKELERLASLFNRPKMEVLNEGILNNIELNFKNEPARHKLLDVMGDMALIGVPIKGHIIALRPGHQTNIEFAKLIKQHIKKEKATEIPRIDFNKKPLYDINDILKILPHRPPFLLVDKILEMDENHVIGLKNVTMNESFFVGHFPDKPLMPGVLQIESMAQTGGVFVLSSVSDPHNYLTYFLSINNVKFRQQVSPGDTLILKLELLSPIRRGISNMKGVAYVRDKIVMEAELMAQIIKKPNVV